MCKILNIKLDREIHEQLEKFCDESGMTKTVAVEKILQHYFTDYFKRPKVSACCFKAIASINRLWVSAIPQNQKIIDFGE